MTDEDKNDDPLRFRFPKWFGPVLGSFVVVIGGMIANNHNSGIKAERDITYLTKAVESLQEDVKRNRNDLDKMHEANSMVQKKMVEGLDELLERERKRGKR